MDDEVDPTWLTNLIDQADKLILAIGGYEEASEHEFSDDESDSSEDEGDAEKEIIGDDTQQAQPRDEPDQKVEPQQSGAVPCAEKSMGVDIGVIDGALLTATRDRDSSEDGEEKCRGGGGVVQREDPPARKEVVVYDPQAKAHDEPNEEAALEQTNAAPRGNGAMGGAVGGAIAAHLAAARDWEDSSEDQDWEDSSGDRDEQCSRKVNVAQGDVAPLVEQETVVGSANKAVVYGASDTLPITPARHQCLHGLDAERGGGGKWDQQKEINTGPELKEVEQGGPPLATPARTRDRVDVDEGSNQRDARESESELRMAPQCEVEIATSPLECIVTPFRNRDRNDFDRDPPPAGILPGGGLISRRMNRATSRNAAPAGERAASKGPHGVLGSSEQTRPMDITEGIEHSRPSPAVNENPTKTLGPGKRGKSRFSYVGDTTWLRPAEDPPESPLAVQELGAGVASESWIPIPPTTASTTEDGGGLKLDGDAPERPDFVVPSVTEGASESLSARRRSREEMEQMLGQDIIATAYPEPETDSEPDKLSNDSLEGPADSDGTDAEELPTLAEENSEENHHPPNSQEVYFPAQASASGNGMREESEGSQGEESSLKTKGGVGTIGAKRASAEDNTRPEEITPEDWIYDAPEAFAPSKRGKMLPEYPFAVMRHSARLDDAIHERQRKLEAMAGGGENGDGLPERSGNGGKADFENGKCDELATIPWADQALRPYDSPIVDTDLPAQQAKELGRHGFGARTLIICSPFRRCLQTAGVVARTLGVAGVTVHLEIGERMDKVRKEIAELAQARAREEDSGVDSKEPVPGFSYLDRVGMMEALGGGVRLEGTVGEQPPEDESGVEAKERFIATIARLREEQLREGPVLVVAHGDTLDAAGESLASQIVFEANYCAWAVFDLNTQSGYVVDSYGIQMIPL